jgi:hypothetical protein
MATVTIGLLLASKLSVNLIGGGLVLLGLVLLVATLAFWRAAIEDPAVLAPLETDHLHEPIRPREPKC